MTATEREFFLLFEACIEDKIKILTELLADTTTKSDQQLKYRIHRAKLFFENREWSHALEDISHIENIADLPDSLLVVKMKSKLQQTSQEVRADLQHRTVHITPNMVELHDLLWNIDPKNTDDYINGTGLLSTSEKNRRSSTRTMKRQKN